MKITTLRLYLFKNNDIMINIGILVAGLAICLVACDTDSLDEVDKHSTNKLKSTTDEENMGGSGTM